MRKHTAYFVQTVYVLSLVCLLGWAGCSPSLKGTIEVPKIPKVKAGKRVGADQASSIYIGAFRDNREDEFLVKFKKKEVKAEAEVVSGVEKALAQALRDKGFSISDDSPLVVSGEVRGWRADIKGGLPSTVNSSAKIYIEVLDPANKRVYSGTYFGNSTIEHPSLDTTDVRSSLGVAMAEAISQVVADKQLIELLASF